MSSSPVHRGGFVVLALSLSALSAFLHLFVYHWLTGPIGAPPVDDPRACAGSNVELADVLHHFAVRLPADAHDLHFSSNLHPLFGDRSMQVRFVTTPEHAHELSRRMRATGTAPHAPAPPPPGQTLHCPAQAGFRPTLQVADTGPSSTSRYLGIERIDPRTAVVLVGASDPD